MRRSYLIICIMYFYCFRLTRMYLFCQFILIYTLTTKYFSLSKRDPREISQEFLRDSCKDITAQKMKFSIMDFFSKSFLWIWSHLLKKSLMKNFTFCAVIKKVLLFLEWFRLTNCHMFLLLFLEYIWRNTSAWVLSCKFTAYFQNTFSQEHTWRGCFWK